MKCTTIFRRGAHRWLAFGHDPDKPERVIDTVQFAVCTENAVALLDPGGMEIFPHMVGALTQEIPVDRVRHIVLSHQDPDVCSSLPLWRKVCRSDLQVHVSALWTGFVSHFDGEARLTAIPDEGADIALGETRLRLVPAHYLHSSGNFNVYDPVARILFSGDIGAALLPEAARQEVFVADFNAHIRYMEGFHRRWMGSPAARDAWIAHVSQLDVDMLAPQHGLIFRGDDVKRFLDWFGRLEIGSGIAAIRSRRET